MRLHRSEKDHRIEGVLRFSAFQLARKKPRTISLQVNRCTSTDLPDASNESSMAAQRRAEARVASTQLYGAQKPHTDTGTCTRANTHTSETGSSCQIASLVEFCMQHASSDQYV